ncbi:adhesion G-protein coupled receptor G7-like isoform X12 [Clavelina lepadiformis]|uniref:adhesion G-protein coupled receptor G7-like isoform X12 n=1 Tax=Clavelina lepadiformis TaxID=159417 RepID=UPI00404170A5
MAAQRLCRQDCPSILENNVAVYNSSRTFNSTGEFACSNGLLYSNGTKLTSNSTLCLATAKWRGQDNVQCLTETTHTHPSILANTTDRSSVATSLADTTDVTTLSTTVLNTADAAVENNTTLPNISTWPWLDVTTFLPDATNTTAAVHVNNTDPTTSNDTNVDAVDNTTTLPKISTWPWLDTTYTSLPTLENTTGFSSIASSLTDTTEYLGVTNVGTVGGTNINTDSNTLFNTSTTAAVLDVTKFLPDATNTTAAVDNTTTLPNISTWPSLDTTYTPLPTLENATGFSSIASSLTDTTEYPEVTDVGTGSGTNINNVTTFLPGATNTTVAVQNTTTSSDISTTPSLGLTTASISITNATVFDTTDVTTTIRAENTTIWPSTATMSSSDTPKFSTTLTESTSTKEATSFISTSSRPTTADSSCIDTICYGCVSCDYDKFGNCLCECITGYKQTTLGQCEAILCQQEAVEYPNAPDIKVTFPSTQTGFSNASVDKCPDATANQGLPYGNRACTLNGTWLAPKWLSSCDANAESFVNVTFNSTTERQEAANNLEVITSEPETLTADDVTTTTQALENVVNAETLDQKTSSAVVATVGNLLSVPEEELQQSGQADSLMETLDSVGEKIELNEGEEYQEVSSTLAIAVVQPALTVVENGIGFQFKSLSTPTELGFRSDQLSTFTGKPQREASSYILLPQQAFAQSQDNRVSFYAFPDDKLFRASTTVGTNAFNDFIGSEIVLSASVVNSTNVQNLETPVVIRLSFTTNASNSENVEKMCVFWDETGNGFWSSKGLIEQNITYETAECKFNHLTNFATLFSTSSVNTPALDLITIIGSSISIVCLALLVITFVFKRKLRKGSGKFRSAFLLVNLGIALLIFNVSLIVSEQPSVQKSGCEVIAVFIHFSLLASLAWMMIEGVVIYISVVHVLYAHAHITDRQVIVLSLVWGWLMPAIFVAVVAGVDISNYTRNDTECWLRKDLVVNLVVIPAAVILGINLLLYIATVAFILFRRRPTKVNRRSSDVRKNIALSLTLFVTVGGTWLFGFAIPGTETYDQTASVVFAYIFTILNALQGLFLFVLYVVRQLFTVDMFKQVVNRTLEPLAKTLSSTVDNSNGGRSRKSVNAARGAPSRSASSGFDVLTCTAELTQRRDEM